MKARWKNEVSLKCLGTVTRALEACPLSYAELASVTGLAPQTIKRAVHILRDDRQVRVEFREKDKRGRETILVFGLGSAPDAKATTMSGAERMRRLRAKKSRADVRGFLYGRYDGQAEATPAV